MAGLVIEFLGLPGAGKSELSHGVAAALAARGIAVSEPSWVLAHAMGRRTRRLRKSGSVLAECLCHPLAGLRAVRSIARSRQPSPGLCGKLACNWLLVLRLLRSARRTDGVHLFDQGLLQATWSLALEGNEHESLRLLQRVPPRLLPDLVIVVEASLPCIEQRLRCRPGADSRLDRDLQRASDLLTRGHRALQVVRQAVQSLSDAPHVVATNETIADREHATGLLTALVLDRIAPCGSARSPFRTLASPPRDLTTVARSLGRDLPRRPGADGPR